MCQGGLEANDILAEARPKGVVHLAVKPEEPALPVAGLRARATEGANEMLRKDAFHV